MEKMTITASETAQRLGISKARTIRLLEFGQIPAIRMGRTWLVPIKTLEDWLYKTAYEEARERSIDE